MYNVFKRPMFKRGGPTKGTGVMSHVEPRVKQQFGTGAEGLISEGMRNQLAREAAKRAALQASISSGVGPTLMTAGTAASTAIPFLLPTGIMASYLYGPEAQKADEVIGMYGEAAPEEILTEASQYLGAPARRASKIESLRSDFDEIRRRKQQAADIAARKMQENKETAEAANKALNKNPGEKTETTYKEADNRSRLQKEADEILGVIQDKDLDRAEAALLVSKALKQGGSLSDKIDYALKDAGGIIKRKGQERQAAKLLAYKTIKEEDIAKIKAGELPGISKVINRLAELQATDPAKLSPTQLKEMQGLESYLEKDNYPEKLQQNTFFKYYTENRGQIPSIEATIAELSKKKKLDAAEAKELADKQKELELLRALEQLTGFGSLKLKEGGRVNYANGTQMESELESQNIEGASNEFPTKTVEKLSFAELRNRLPKEITDDVVSLIATSEEALQDFAYIRTQQDINNFNVKYGVNLILPPAKG
jgi:hypothetical protein